MNGSKLLEILLNTPKEDLEKEIRLDTEMDFGILKSVFVSKQGNLVLTTEKR